MKKPLLIPIVFLSLFSCQMMQKELEKANSIRTSTLKVCDCNDVSVNTNTTNGVKKVTIIVSQSNANDLSSKAEEIMDQLENDYPKINEHKEIIIQFENDTLTEEYAFEGNETTSLTESQGDMVVSLSHLNQ